ncbi:hypothetical protein BYT27DRAFT_6498201 [Phlegmacium glaucopus]|nr:hypothetical protein BYT27DRAFT_6498201 [Phlegmacium glaucopus]
MERGLNGRWLLFYEELKMGMPLLYTRLVSSILLRPHPMDVNAPLLPATLDVRVQIKQTRLELLKWIGKHWLAIRQECGFDPLERWALKEISDYPIDDLLNPPPQTANLKNHSPKRQLQQRQPVFYDPLQTIHILLKWMRKVIWLVVCALAFSVQAFLHVKLPPVLSLFYYFLPRPREWFSSILC